MPWQALKNALGLSDASSLRGALDQVRQKFGLDPDLGERSAQSQVAFTIAVVALAAKMSKADGVASDLEMRAFETSFSVPASEIGHVRRLFAQAAQDVAGYESYARQIAQMLHAEPELKVAVLECLFHIASADGVLHPDEDDYLHTVALIVGISEDEFRSVRRAFVNDPDSPYEILNVAPGASDAELKSRYRELVKSHHPDLLVSKGVPEEFLAAAERRLAAITGAYEEIKRQRGKRRDTQLERSS